MSYADNPSAYAPEKSFFTEGSWLLFWTILLASIIGFGVREWLGYGTRKWVTFITPVAGFFVVVIEYYYLWTVVFTHVNDSSWYDVISLRRYDCFLSTKGGKQSESSRDCWGNRGPKCTKEEPCTPCNWDIGLTKMGDAGTPGYWGGTRQIHSSTQVTNGVDWIRPLLKPSENKSLLETCEIRTLLKTIFRDQNNVGYI